MRVCVKLKGLATMQKVMGYAMIVMASCSERDMFGIGFGVLAGVLISETADVWYKLVNKCEQ